MGRNEQLIPVLRHGQFDGPGAKERSYRNFVASLSAESITYPLTEEGGGQILETLAQVPGCEETNLILTSQFTRARESAQVISDHIETRTGRAVRVVQTPLLNTVWMPPNSLTNERFNQLEQSGRGRVAEEMFQIWSRGFEGESPEMVGRRAKIVISQLDRLTNAGLRPIVITHASFASAMQRHLQGVSLVKPRDEKQILKTSGYFLLALNRNRLEASGVETSQTQYLA